MFSTTAMADETFDPSAGGVAVDIADTNGAGDGLTYNPSPGVSMSAITKPTAYALSAANVSAAVENRNEYGVWSGYGGYYQQPSDADAATAPTTTIDVTAYDPEGTTPFTTAEGWTPMGGSGGAS